MRSFRFSIAGLMGLVLLAAIGAAGLANPSGPWAGILALLARAVLCLALVGAVGRGMKDVERGEFLVDFDFNLFRPARQ